MADLGSWWGSHLRKEKNSKNYQDGNNSHNVYTSRIQTPCQLPTLQSHSGQNSFAPWNHLSDRKVSYELFVRRVCPLSHRFCVGITFHHPVHGATQFPEQPAEEIRFGHTSVCVCQGNCVSPWPTHPCLCCGVGIDCSALPCSHLSCCDFGGGGVTAWNWDKVKGNKGLWFQRVSTSQLISHVRKVVLRK